MKTLKGGSKHVKLVRAAKQYHFNKASQTRCYTFLIFLWYSVGKLRSIISVSPLLQVLCFATYSIFALLVAKIGISVLIQTSVANWFLGDEIFKFSPSRSIKSSHHINSLLHLKSCKTITSPWSAPTQAYLSLAG